LKEEEEEEEEDKEKKKKYGRQILKKKRISGNIYVSYLIIHPQRKRLFLREQCLCEVYIIVILR